MPPVALLGAGVALLAVTAVLSRRRRGRSVAGAVPAGAPPLPASTPGAATTGGLVGVLARHRWARRTLGGIAAALVVAAVGVAGYPLLTDRYTETLQTRLEQQLVRGSTRTAYLAGRIEVGDSLTRIKIPKIGLDTVVVEGASERALRAGAGHFPETPLPCEDGNVAIAGHRTTYGKPFAELDRLAVGDEISLETPVGSCTYEVATAPFQVDPSDVWVAGPTDDPRLTLSTCHPEGSAKHRLVLQATKVADHQGPAA
ncbi:MAG TPA: class D sortase [Aquihabitans sp.]|nr:class D sortase [Aquihabitans sp.]